MKNEEQAITQTFTNYIDSFQTLQTKNVLRFCDTLRLIISPQGLRTMTAPKEVEELIGQLMASLKARDFSRSEITNMRVSQMSDDIAFVSVSRVRYKTDGKELDGLVKPIRCKKWKPPGKL